MKLYIYRYTNDDRKIAEDVVEVRETEKTYVAVNKDIPVSRYYGVSKVLKSDCEKPLTRNELTYIAPREAHDEVAKAFYDWYMSRYANYQTNAQIMKENAEALKKLVAERERKP